MKPLKIANSIANSTEINELISSAESMKLTSTEVEQLISDFKNGNTEVVDKIINSYSHLIIQIAIHLLDDNVSLHELIFTGRKGLKDLFIKEQNSKCLQDYGAWQIKQRILSYKDLKSNSFVKLTDFELLKANLIGTLTNSKPTNNERIEINNVISEIEKLFEKNKGNISEKELLNEFSTAHFAFNYSVEKLKAILDNEENKSLWIKTFYDGFLSFVDAKSV
jgi:flagellar biosynthesis component FlhA